jgi:hypothetical protein
MNHFIKSAARDRLRKFLAFNNSTSIKDPIELIMEGEYQFEGIRQPFDKATFSNFKDIITTSAHFWIEPCFES